MSWNSNAFTTWPQTSTPFISREVEVATSMPSDGTYIARLDGRGGLEVFWKDGYGRVVHAIINSQGAMLMTSQNGLGQSVRTYASWMGHVHTANWGGMVTISANWAVDLQMTGTTPNGSVFAASNHFSGFYGLMARSSSDRQCVTMGAAGDFAFPATGTGDPLSPFGGQGAGMMLPAFRRLSLTMTIRVNLNITLSAGPSPWPVRACFHPAVEEYDARGNRRPGRLCNDRDCMLSKLDGLWNCCRVNCDTAGNTARKCRKCPHWCCQYCTKTDPWDRRMIPPLTLRW
ncbi:hypothetical protein BP00DRAFT_446414 [Aspergillus indologenus CBS 114.80]|uniref:Uncharacterized protein n=1 Tax=Aspergillus indologenus CBS 114.80 TaxID=1450541 RepID=A0A2V5I6D9_9EURO|nr:hypothetical protein BP00DRAFT_446414 [Aspergillus indologenus CBS 114.80]